MAVGKSTEPGKRVPAHGPQRRTKFGNKRVEIDGIKFDSKAEARCWQQLKEQEARGEIERLERQVRFPLYAICLWDDEHPFDGDICSPERNAEKVCDYVADFTYYRDGKYTVVDVKGGVITDLFKLKAKMFRACYGFEITVVTMGRA